MGKIFALPPSPWEIGHAAGIKEGIAYQDSHGDTLPDSSTWRMLERRYDINPLRFQYWHPNIALMIERSRFDRGPDPAPLPPPLLPCNPPPPCVIAPPPPCGNEGGSHVVPEPSTLTLLLIGAVAGFVGGRLTRSWIRLRPR